MSIPPHSLSMLQQNYPHCKKLLQAFVPMVDAQEFLCNDLPAPNLPQINTQAFSQGAPYLPATIYQSVYVDAPFLAQAPAVIAQAAGACFVKIKKPCKDIGTYLLKNTDECKKLVAYGLKNKLQNTVYWAKKNDQHKQATQLMAKYLASAAAHRVAHAVANLPAWDKPTCPICGASPQAAFLQHAEGNKYLSCSLCGHAWRFSRTTCPSCGDTKPEHQQVFYLEDDSLSRAEACLSCKQYLLTPDLRTWTGDIPFPLMLLCLAPIDILMQQKGYTQA